MPQGKQMSIKTDLERRGILELIDKDIKIFIAM